jgi:hypothetical protein
MPRAAAETTTRDAAGGADPLTRGIHYLYRSSITTTIDKKVGVMTTTTRERSDSAMVLTIGILAAIATVWWGADRAYSTFGAPLGIAWNIKIDEMPVDATVGSSTGDVSAIVGEGTVFAEHVNAVSVTMIIMSLVVSALTALVVIACIMFLARSASRGAVFTRRTARAWDVIGASLIIGGVLMLVGDTLGGNGVLAAVGLQDADVAPSVGFWGFAPMWAVGCACGLIGIAYRRGLALQRETEGLV